MEAITALISTVGFPIVAVLGLAWFIYQIFQKTTSANEKQMEQMAQRCQAREDKLYEQIDKFNNILISFNATLASIDTRLEMIEQQMAETQKETE